MAKKEIKTYSLTEMKDKYIGNVGTPGRDEYEYELRMDIILFYKIRGSQEKNQLKWNLTK